MSSISRRICSITLILLLCFTQYGCEGSVRPPDSVLKDAIELKIQLTHRSLAEGLALGEETPEVIRIKVDSSTSSQYEEGKFISVSGYSICKFPGFGEEIKSPFHLFLERGEKGQSWRLADKSFSSNGIEYEWTTYPLPINN